MNKRTVFAATLALACFAATGTSAQQMKVYRYNDRQSRVELVPFGGYAFTFSKEFYYGIASGELDMKDSGYFGVNLDINVRQGAQARLQYRRQDTEAQFTSLGARTTVDGALEYWQIGGLTGMPRGNVFPYFSLTLGGTRFLVNDDDIWKFSMIAGLGAKVYSSGRFGLQVQATFPFTFVDGGGSISCGGGGCFTSIGGTGVGQFDVGAGIIIGL